MLKDQMNAIITELRAQGKNILAQTIADNWQLSVVEYSKKINIHEPRQPMELALVRAFEKEFVRLGYDETEIKDLLADLEQNRIIQTANHTAASQLPRYTCIDWLQLQGLSKGQRIFGSMFSDEPFSNSSRPGMLNIGTQHELSDIIDPSTRRYQEVVTAQVERERHQKSYTDLIQSTATKSVNLMPSKMQYEVIYRSSIPERLVQTCDCLHSEIKKLFPQPIVGESYTAWALKSNQVIESEAFDDSRLVFFDPNEVIAHYLAEVFTDPNHFVTRMFFDAQMREKISQVFGPHRLAFSVPYQSGKYLKTDTLTIYNDKLVGKKVEYQLDPQTIITALQEDRLCAKTFTMFTILAFRNHFKCCGSFRTTEYLPEYQRQWIASGLISAEEIGYLPTNNLTTGMFPGNDFDVHALDLALGSRLEFTSDRQFGELLAPMAHVLTKRETNASLYREDKSLLAMDGKRVHVIGVAGKGMSAVAVLLREKGCTITGSDEGVYDPIASYLTKMGIDYATEYDPQNIPEDTDVIVIGRHARLDPEKNAEVARAFELQNTKRAKVLSYPEVLQDLTRETKNQVVIGSYGKSTCTGMLTWCLLDNDLDPSYFVPAVPIGFDQTSHIGSGKHFVLEGDEYPTSLWDSQAKFLYYNASSILLTSGEHDHMNVFPTIEDYLAPYRQLLRGLHDGNLVVGCIDNPNVENLLTETQAKTVTYGLDIGKNPDWYAENIVYGETTTFDLCHQGQKIVSVSTQLLGKHNVQNIVGVMAMVLEQKLTTPEKLAETIKKFRGIVRRLDKKTTQSTVPVYEGYGSSFTKAQTAIAAMKLHFPSKRLVVVFEPHTFSWRNKANLAWYDTVFAGADKVIIYKPPTHGANTHDQVDLSQIAKRTTKAGFEPIAVSHKAMLVPTVSDQVQKDDVVLFLSSGSFDGELAPSIQTIEEQYAT